MCNNSPNRQSLLYSKKNVDPVKKAAGSTVQLAQDIGSKLGSPPNPSQHWQSWSLKKLKTEGALLVFFPAPCLSLTVHCSVKTAVQEPMADVNDVT